MTRTRCLLITTCVIALLLLITPQLFAQTCIQDEYNSFNGTHKNLSCTANDVRVASIVNGSLNVFQGGLGNKCVQGGKFSFTATFNIVTTSSSARSNIGIFFGSGQSQALTGTCSQAIISPTHPCAGAANLTCGDANYYEADNSINGETSPTGCGDTSSNDNFGFGSGVQQATLEVDNVTCPSNASPCPAGVGNPGDVCLALPTCTGWYQPTNTMPNCSTTAPNYPWVPAAVPGTTSKCDCGPVFIPVQPITPQVSVAKSCNSATELGAGLTTCHEGPGDVSGNTVTYHVGITNTTPSNEGGVIIDQICDSLYGTLYRAGSFTGTACAAGTIGTNGSITNNGCSAGTTPNDITTTGSCDFTAHQNEDLTEQDVVSVNGHSDLVTTSSFGPTSSNTVTVISTDSPTSASTTKNFAATEAACATVRYTVNVSNTSGQDETINLSALNDSTYGSITSIHDSVLGTTCGVDKNSVGLGTLIGSNGAGAFPIVISPGAPAYQCQFDGQFCGPILTNAEQFGSGVCTAGSCTSGKVGACTKNSDCDNTCTGISETDTVTATLGADEAGDAITQSITGLNVTECVTPNTSPH